MVLHLKTCCCGCSLRTGTIIIGILSVLTSLHSIYFAISQLLKDSESTRKVFENSGFTGMHYDTMAAVETVEAIVIVRTMVVIGGSFTSIFYLISSIILLYGIDRRPGFIRLWVVYAALQLTVEIIFLAAFIVALLYTGLGAIAAMMIIIAVLGNPLQVYFILVVNSYHAEVSNSKTYAASSETTKTKSNTEESFV